MDGPAPSHPVTQSSRLQSTIHDTHPVCLFIHPSIHPCPCPYPYPYPFLHPPIQSVPPPAHPGSHFLLDHPCLVVAPRCSQPALQRAEASTGRRAAAPSSRSSRHVGTVVCTTSSSSSSPAQGRRGRRRTQYGVPTLVPKGPHRRQQPGPLTTSPLPTTRPVDRICWIQ